MFFVFFNRSSSPVSSPQAVHGVTQALIWREVWGPNTTTPRPIHARRYTKFPLITRIINYRPLWIPHGARITRNNISRTRLGVGNANKRRHGNCAATKMATDTDHERNWAQLVQKRSRWTFNVKTRVTKRTGQRSETPTKLQLNTNKTGSECTPTDGHPSVAKRASTK